MVSKTKNIDGQFFVPDIFANNPSKKPTGAASLENFLTIGNTVNSLKIIFISNKEILTSYATVLFYIVYLAQAKLNAKLIVPRKADSSIEKIFQQTETHGKSVKLISNSKSAKILLSLYGIQLAISQDYYAFVEQDVNLDDTTFGQSIVNDFDKLISEKGIGGTKLRVSDAESRLCWIRGKSSSLRSKWCSIPTYSPNKVASSNINVKLAKSIDVFQYLNKLFNKLVELNIVDINDIPKEAEIKNQIQEELDYLRIDRIICDDVHGSFNNIPLEEIFGFERTTNEEVNKTKAPLPNIAIQLKSLIK